MNNLFTIALVIIVFLVVTSLWGFVSALHPPKITTDTTPADYNLAFEHVEFTTEDGVLIDGWFIPQQDEESDKPGKSAIIVMHGYPADKGDVLGRTAFLADQYDLLYFDFRGLGKSDGSYSTAGMFERRDLAAAIDYLEKHGYESIGLWGFSVGGATALMQAPEEESVQATVAISSYARLSHISKELFRIPVLDTVLAQLVRLYGWIWFGEDIRDVSPADSIAEYDRPVFLIHPQDDQVIPVSEGREIQQALEGNDNAQFWFPAGTHGAFPQDEHIRRVRAFFGSHL